MMLPVPPSLTDNSIEQVRHYLDQALSDNTKLAYRKDMEHFIGWGGSIPCSPDIIAHYLSSHAETNAMATLCRWLVSIRKAHTMQGCSDPTKSDLVKLTLKGIKRVHGKPQAQASPILKEDLVVMLSHCPDTAKGRRDAALLLLGFCGALRRSELVAVKVEDLEFNSQGLILTIPRSKTDQNGEGRKIAIPRGKGKICPVELVDSYFKKSSACNRHLFTAISKGGRVSNCPLSDRAVSDIIKHYASKAGLNPEKYSGHSLRSGLCTSAAQHGISSYKIRQQTGHRSDAMLSRYIRDGDIFNNNAAGLF